jgi:hypothetical protein
LVVNNYIFSSEKGLANTVGEFFNPGHDCSDILNNCQDAKDGFFWITAGLPNPKKVKKHNFTYQWVACPKITCAKITLSSIN